MILSIVSEITEEKHAEITRWHHPVQLPRAERFRKRGPAAAIFLALHQFIRWIGKFAERAAADKKHLAQ